MLAATKPLKFTASLAAPYGGAYDNSNYSKSKTVNLFLIAEAKTSNLLSTPSLPTI